MIERRIPTPAMAMGRNKARSWKSRTAAACVTVPSAICSLNSLRQQDAAGKSCNAQSGRGQDRTAVGFVKVGAHAGHVAHVVAHVVGDCGRVALVVFGNAGFDFTDQVGADVGGLGEDAAAHAGEQRLAAGTHAEAEHGHGDRDQPQRLVTQRRHEPVEHGKPQGNVQKPQADDRQTP